MINNDQSKKTNLTHSPSAVNILGRDNGGGYNLFPENLYITAERVNMLHLWTFNCLFPDVRTVPLCNIDSSQIGFAAISELDDFQKWHSSYLSKFPNGMKDLQYPPPVDRHYPHMINWFHNNNKNTNSKSSYDERHNLWIWCLENALHEVRIVGDFFFFEDVEDVALFTLKSQ